MAKQEEIDYKKTFCLKYFGKTGWRLDVNKVDVLLETRVGRPLLYIESKHRIKANSDDRRRAIAQIILTNKKQKLPLQKVAIIYYDIESNRDMLELIDCSDNVLDCHEVKWNVERPSTPSEEAVYHLNNRVASRITTFKGEEEIIAFYNEFKKSKRTCITITEKNSAFIYNQWKAEVEFEQNNIHEQELINLFLADMLDNTKYRKQDGLFEQPLIRENTNLSCYEVMEKGICYKGKQNSYFYYFANKNIHDDFWKRYHRPPEKEEFLNIMEHSNKLYSEKYRSDTGGEYTPSAFVALQNELILKHYNINDFVVFDPCAGVGNLENDFGRDYKDYCYLSTLLPGDVDQCKFKDFGNAVVFDYMKDKNQPRWQYKGEKDKTINEIAANENRQLMVVMNPPYVKVKGKKYDLCIEFFQKVLNVNPSVIVFYCKTEFFFRPETAKIFEQSGYKIVEHVISNAKTTFKLSEWPISLVIFDRNQGDTPTIAHTRVKRYEPNSKTEKMEFKGLYDYDNTKPCLINEFEKAIRENAHGMQLGQWTNDRYCIILSNRSTHGQHITTGNLKLALILKGLNFNTHPRYYETSNYVYRGYVKDISEELATDAIIFALFYKGNNFSNKENIPNYFMPFTAQELGCSNNCLNILLPNKREDQLFPNIEEDYEPFDFRKFIASLNLSNEARELYNAALSIVRYYHCNEVYAINRDFNDSFYDITNAIMGKDVASFRNIDKKNDTRLTKVKTTKNTRGFSLNNLRGIVKKEILPTFEIFFNARKTLAEKINRELFEQRLILWPRENIF